MAIYILKITRYLEHKRSVELLLPCDCWAGTILGVFADKNTAIHLAREYNRQERNLENRLYYTVVKETIRTFKI